MAGYEQDLYIVDVDLTIVDWSSGGCELMKGSRQLLEVLSGLGELRLWSAGGRDYCHQVVNEFGFTDLVSDCHNKPEFPPTVEESVLILGRVATLQVDDDYYERVPGWEFLDPEAARAKYVHGWPHID